MSQELLINEELERREILRKYKQLLKAVDPKIKSKEQLKRIHKAYELACDKHIDMRRKSGEPYIYHPIAVAQICAEELGLGVTSVICGLLHDTVEDTDLTLDDVNQIFGEEVAKIIDGLTKISGVFDQSESIQAENFRKIILTLSDDLRVILVKLADRLHNMRTLEHMRRDKQLKIANETLYLFAPLAHRLGLYAIKTELEDLALKYVEPEKYEEILNKLEKTKEVRERFISSFIHPIKKALVEQGLQCEIKGRTKSIYSIYNKIVKKGVPFEEIYDIFAIRIIIDSRPENEKADCWRAYSIVTDLYKPKPDRMRDWISFPRSNGYESLHITVMSPSGKWVEVQIRTERMDEISERGYAAHWKYKEPGKENVVDDWILRIREILENNDSAVDIVESFKLDLETKEIFIFTPKGELRTLKSGTTVLDFAYDIHSEIGDKCIGAKVNNKLVPISYVLNSGDQVEVLTSSKQKPKEDWLKLVISSKARERIKSALKEEKRKVAVDGKEIFQRKLRQLGVTFSENDINHILSYFKVPDVQDFYYKVATGGISNYEIKQFYKDENNRSWYQYLANKIRGKSKDDKKEKTLEELIKEAKRDSDSLVIGDSTVKLDYKLSSCCNPIPGDEVFGFVTVSDGIKIHKTTCPNAMQLMSNYAYRIVKARWTNRESLAFLAGIKVDGFDEVGIVNRITKIISNQLKVNMRSISFETKDGLFEGNIMVYVQDTNHLNDLMVKLKGIPGVINVTRIN